MIVFCDKLVSLGTRAADVKLLISSKTRAIKIDVAQHSLAVEDQIKTVSFRLACEALLDMLAALFAQLMMLL